MARLKSITDKLNEILKPICWVCKKEVDSMQSENDYMNNCKVFLVRCHGESEIASIDQQTLISLDVPKLGRGYAFMPKKQIAEVKKIEADHV